MRITSVWRFALALVGLILVIFLLIWGVLRLTQHHPANAPQTANTNQHSTAQQQKQPPATSSNPQKSGSSSSSSNSTPATGGSQQSAGQPKQTATSSTASGGNLSHTGPGDVVKLFVLVTLGGTLVAHAYQAALRRAKAR